MMRSATAFRLILLGAVLALATLGWLLLFRPAEAPAPAAKFDPAALAGPRPRLDAPYVASGMEVVDAMLGIANVRAGDFLIDLGSGDGRILIAAARSLRTRGLGVDIDPRRVAEAVENARNAGVAYLVSFRREDLFATPLGEADVLTLYLTQEVNLRLRERILAQMRPGTRVVSHDFDMGDWRWDDRRTVGGTNVYLWIVPARIDGDWTLHVDGRVLPLVIEQRYQSFGGLVRESRIEQGRISGANIRFRANLGDGRRWFEGRFTGNSIVPTDSRADWRATRN